MEIDSHPLPYRQTAGGAAHATAEGTVINGEGDAVFTYLTPGRNMRAETKDTSAPVSMITMHREPSSEATARVWAGRKSGRGSRGVGSIPPRPDLDRCWVSSASRLTAITLAASRVDPSTTDLPGGPSLASQREVAHPGYHLPQLPPSRTRSRLQPRHSSMRCPGGLGPLARSEAVEVRV